MQVVAYRNLEFCATSVSKSYADSLNFFEINRKLKFHDKNKALKIKTITKTIDNRIVNLVPNLKSQGRKIIYSRIFNVTCFELGVLLQKKIM